MLLLFFPQQGRPSVFFPSPAIGVLASASPLCFSPAPFILVPRQLPPPGPGPQREPFRAPKDRGTPWPETSGVADLALTSVWPPTANVRDSWLGALKLAKELASM